MNLQNQVCSLEFAKRLKELGVVKSSLFFHTLGGVVSRLEALPILDNNYSAFTVAELGEMLPLRIIKGNKLTINGNDHLINFDYHLKISPFVKGYWYCCYIGYPILEGLTLSNLGSNSFSENDKTMANAVAKMLIYLLENKLMELPNET